MIHILLTDAALVIKFKLTYEQTIKDNIVLILCLYYKWYYFFLLYMCFVKYLRYYYWYC